MEVWRQEDSKNNFHKGILKVLNVLNESGNPESLKYYSLEWSPSNEYHISLTSAPSIYLIWKI